MIKAITYAKKYRPALVGIVVLLATAAFGQQQQPQQGLMLQQAQELEGQSVVDTQGRELGTIEDLIVETPQANAEPANDTDNNQRDNNGTDETADNGLDRQQGSQLRFVVVQLEDQLYAVPAAAMEFCDVEHRYILDMDRQALSRQESFSEDDWPELTTEWAQQTERQYQQQIEALHDDVNNDTPEPKPNDAPGPENDRRWEPGTSPQPGWPRPDRPGRPEDGQRYGTEPGVYPTAPQPGRPMPRLHNDGLAENDIDNDLEPHRDRDLHRYSRLRDIEVFGSDDAQLGTLEDVVIEVDRGRLAFAILAMARAQDVQRQYSAVPYTALQFDIEQQRALVDADQQRLERYAMEEIDLGMLEDQQLAQELYADFGLTPYWEVFAYVPGVEDERTEEDRIEQDPDDNDQYPEDDQTL